MNEPQPAPAWDQVLSTLTACWRAENWCEVGVLIGCSGGADSVALLRAVAQLRQQQPNALGFLSVAHYNHRLRGDESDCDEAFVRELAERLSLDFECEHGDGSASDEATLREQRLQFLLARAKRIGARYIAVAHTLDDNVETVLHHLMRGTGPSGLAGIAVARPLDDDFVLIRPLLSVRREQLRCGLSQIGQPWREDSTNAGSDYSRNWIRNQLIPLIESQYPEAVDAIGRAVGGQRMWRETIDRQASLWLAEHLVSGPEIALRRDPNSDSAILIAALQRLWDQQNWPRREMARPQWTRLATTVQGSESERYSLPSAIEVLAENDLLKIYPPRC
jgi:tRNA(Ile)-lysidine synthase